MEEKKLITGGEFLVKETSPADVFIPEELDEEQRMIGETCKDFLETEVFPVADRIDAQEEGLMRSLLEKSGELGLLGITIPEEYEGFGQSFITNMYSSEILGAGYSYAVAYSCHTGIGTLPILYYGNEEQRAKYIPKLATGELIGAYCLTEPGAGSDANSGTTKAVLSEDGKHYVINGAKMWITNGGFADVMTVFAKIDNDRVLSAFILDRDFEGIIFNPEEKKMGIKGSSTRQIFFNDVKVPVENMLGKRGEGFRIALNILHMGRIKLGANVIGSAKKAIDQSVQYANERKQFNCLISQFGAIKYKLAEQVIRTFATECSVYRASKALDDAIAYYVAKGDDKGRNTMEAFNHFAVEAAAMKVFASEALDYVADEGVQIHGGMGFSAEMMIEKGYRDSRINRIFEGTNEINRLLLVDSVLKKGARGVLPIMELAGEAFEEVKKMNGAPAPAEGWFEEKDQYVANLKKVVLMLLKSASDKFNRTLVQEQEILSNISDCIIQVYVAESVVLRLKKMESMKGEEETKLYRDMADVFVYDAAARIAKFARDTTYSFANGEVLDLLEKGISNFTSVAGVNVKEARRRIADQLIEENKYCF
ncbi:MAG: acyl-CoA dehydrogenase family protein [Bacteroidales bacterium]|nr:acyl-CoA dehydrogenase family protein [Bacteroidales bacterium]